MNQNSINLLFLNNISFKFEENISPFITNPIDFIVICSEETEWLKNNIDKDIKEGSYPNIDENDKIYRKMKYNSNEEYVNETKRLKEINESIKV